MEPAFSKAAALRHDVERYERLLRSMSDVRLLRQLQDLLAEARQQHAEIEHDGP